MDSASHLLSHSNSHHHSVNVGLNFGRSVPSRLGRPIPGPFAHFSIPPFGVPSLTHPYEFHTSQHFQTLAAAATAYSIDSLLHAGANANNSANLIASLTPSSLNNSLHSIRETNESNLRTASAKKGEPYLSSKLINFFGQLIKENTFIKNF